MRTLIQVDYQGNVTLLTQGIYMTKCQIDVSHYPFDPQRCSLKFASWTTESTRLNLSIGENSQDWIITLNIIFIRNIPSSADSGNVLGFWSLHSPTVLCKEI